MPRDRAKLNCAIYTRKSSEEGLEQEFNSLDAQRESCEAFIQSQKHEGWQAVRSHYDDGGFSGGNMGRPGLRSLLADIDAGRVQVVVVYKVDRLTRSLADFAKIIETFDAHGVSFVSVTQQFNTTSSMGRLTLNVLLSFAQFEREVTGERIRDKIAASKKKGMWMGAVLVGFADIMASIIGVPVRCRHRHHPGPGRLKIRSGRVVIGGFLWSKSSDALFAAEVQSNGGPERGGNQSSQLLSLSSQESGRSSADKDLRSLLSSFS